MESKKRDRNEISEAKTLKKSCYSNRKECIKKKTRELATLCGINACTIIYGIDGEIESWPENPTAAKAIIRTFKDLTNNPKKKTTVRDESYKQVIEIETCPTAANKAIIKNFEDSTFFAVPENLTKSLQSLMTGYEKELLKQLDGKLEALTERIEFLRKEQECNTYSCCIENKQVYYSEETSSERIESTRAPLFMFDLNLPPPAEAECSSLSSEDYHHVHNR